MTVRYTPGQLRDAVGISQETYRHWKKALPPLRGGAGHGPRFSVGELQFIHDTESTAFRTPILVIPLQSSILRLRAALLTELDRDPQRSLPFPPTPTTPGSADGAMEAQA